MISPTRAMASALLMASAAKVAAAQPACDRQCPEGLVDRYLDALVRHDPSAAPTYSADAAKRVAALGRSPAPFAGVPTAQRKSRSDLAASANECFTGMQRTGAVELPRAARVRAPACRWEDGSPDRDVTR